jgi:two-component system OmpR family sensor kinase
MRESLRGRLLLWHVAILATVVALFSASVSLVVWRSRIAEIDSALQAEADVLVRAIEPAEEGTFDLTLAPELRSRSLESYHAIWASDGTLVDRSDASREIPPPVRTEIRTRRGQRELLVEAPAGAIVLVGRDLSEPWRETWSLAVTLLAVGGVVLVLSVGSGWFLVGRALAPIERINRTAQRMIEGDLAARIPVDQVETELGQVGHALNDAFDRLRSSIARQKRFTADASHELRTPLATLSTEVQWALGRDRTPEAYRESLDVCLRAATRMQTTVERLLTLARADDPSAGTSMAADVDLDDLVRGVLKDLEPLAGSRSLTTEYTGEPIVVRGRRDELREAVTNVAVNAIRYNVDHGRLAVSVHADDSSAVIAVTDTGIGIAPEDLPFIFDPFFRADSSRSHDAGGAGLGLAVARTTIERHGGTIECTSTVDQGTRVVIHLPRTRP